MTGEYRKTKSAVLNAAKEKLDHKELDSLIESLKEFIAAMKEFVEVDGSLTTATSSYAEILRSVMDTQFGAILKLELAKIHGPATEDPLTE